MARSLNKAILIGNITADPELRVTQDGTQVCSFSIATNRDWKTENGEKKEETQYHKIVAWKKLAELCASMLHKGSRVYVEGRLSTREREDREKIKRYTTEIIINDMILLDSKGKEQEDVQM